MLTSETVVVNPAHEFAISIHQYCSILSSRMQCYGFNLPNHGIRYPQTMVPIDQNETYFANSNVAKRLPKRQCHARAILTDEQARQIFRCKPTSSINQRHKATYLARCFGVNAKTVRDIWVGRTWYWATYTLDSAKPILLEKLQKKLGRPKGSKDSKLRDRKPCSDGPETAETKFGSAKGGMKEGKIKRLEMRLSRRNEDYSSNSASSLLGSLLFCRSNAEKVGNIIQDTISGWHDQLLCDLTTTDPFHDDWAFWPKSGKRD